jgi:hypothetical protein
MCKHNHSTIVTAWLDDGTPVHIHQCDMCGLTLPATNATEAAEPPPVDIIALDAAFDRIWRQLFPPAQRRR